MSAAVSRRPMRPMQPVLRLSSVRSFDELTRHGMPVVLTGAARVMPAFERWTDEYLKAVLGDSPTLVRLVDGRFARMPASSFIDYLSGPERFPSSRGPVYLTDFYIHPTFDDPVRERLAEDVFCPLPRTGPHAEWISLYAGPAGTGTPIHQDVFATNTWLAQLRGEKIWRLCAPGALARESVDAFGDDDLGCDVYEVVLTPGDVIYLPPDWWHQVRNRTASLALSGNFCSIPHARAALAGVLARPDSASKEIWAKTWRAVLEAS